MPIPNSVSRALRGWRPTKLSVLIGEYENIVAEFGLAFRRTEEARELDIFMFASDALAHEFAKLGSATGVLMS